MSRRSKGRGQDAKDEKIKEFQDLFDGKFDKKIRIRRLRDKNFATALILAAEEARFKAREKAEAKAEAEEEAKIKAKDEAKAKMEAKKKAEEEDDEIEMLFKSSIPPTTTPSLFSGLDFVEDIWNKIASKRPVLRLPLGVELREPNRYNIEVVHDPSFAREIGRPIDFRKYSGRLAPLMDIPRRIDPAKQFRGWEELAYLASPIPYSTGPSPEDLERYSRPAKIPAVLAYTKKDLDDWERAMKTLYNKAIFRTAPDLSQRGKKVEVKAKSKEVVVDKEREAKKEMYRELFKKVRYNTSAKRFAEIFNLPTAEEMKERPLLHANRAVYNRDYFRELAKLERIEERPGIKRTIERDLEAASRNMGAWLDSRQMKFHYYCEEDEIRKKNRKVSPEEAEIIKRLCRSSKSEKSYAERIYDKEWAAVEKLLEAASSPAYAHLFKPEVLERYENLYNFILNVDKPKKKKKSKYDFVKAKVDTRRSKTTSIGGNTTTTGTTTVSGVKGKGTQQSTNLKLKKLKVKPTLQTIKE